MAITTGLFNTGLNPAELNMRSFASHILRLFPNGSAPMFALSSQSGKSKAVSSTHGYFSKTMQFIRIVMGAAGLVGDTSLTVPSTAGIVKGMVLYNQRTRENVRVTAITSGTVLAVTRAFGRTPAAAINVADVWIHVGSAYEEGSLRPEARRLQPVYVPNFTQIFRNAWALTGTAKASMSEMGYSNVQEDKNECAMFHAVDIETAIIWGQPKMDVSGTTPIHATQGVIDAIRQYAPTNVNAAAGTTTYEQLVTLTDPAFQYSSDIGNPKERVAFVDSVAMRVITDIGRKNGQIQMQTSQTSFGMRFTNFSFYRGTINLIEHPLLNGLQQSGTALIMDMGALKLAYMEGRDTKAEEYGFGANGKLVENGIDAVGGSLLTEAAVELVNPFACALITGLTAGAAS